MGRARTAQHAVPARFTAMRALRLNDNCAMKVFEARDGDRLERDEELRHERGARTIAQNEETCVVFGMPKETIALGGVDEMMPLNQVARSILQFDARG